MVGLSLILNFIGNTFLKMVWLAMDKMEQKREALNSDKRLQYNNTGEDNEVDTPEVTI